MAPGGCHPATRMSWLFLLSVRQGRGRTLDWRDHRRSTSDCGLSPVHHPRTNTISDGEMMMCSSRRDSTYITSKQGGEMRERPMEGGQPQVIVRPCPRLHVHLRKRPQPRPEREKAGLSHPVARSVFNIPVLYRKPQTKRSQETGDGAQQCVRLTTLAKATATRTYIYSCCMNLSSM